MDNLTWDKVLSAAAHLQQILPDAILTGGSAAAVHARHRISTDADHVLTTLRKDFDQVLGDLESVAGWKTARLQRPVLILGNLDGIDTGVRQLIRSKPLETETMHLGNNLQITVPTQAETLRIKGVLILRRNAYRDYLDFAAMANHIGGAEVVGAMTQFDSLYPQDNGESALQQLIAQLANPKPFDLQEGELVALSKNLAPEWQDWDVVKRHCVSTSMALFQALILAEDMKKAKADQGKDLGIDQKGTERGL